MKGLKIIPMFMVMIVLCYFGVLFVQANSEQVALTFGAFQTPSVPLGFAVLTAILAGMIVAGFLSILELVILFMENKQLRKRLSKYEEVELTEEERAETLEEDNDPDPLEFDATEDASPPIKEDEQPQPH